MPVFAAKEQSHDVGYNQPDESYDAAERDHRADHDGGGNQHDIGGALRVYADALRRFHAHLHDIQVFGIMKKHDQPDHHNGEEPGNLHPGYRGEAAHCPEIDFVHGLLVDDNQQGDDGGDEEVEGDAGEQERLGVVLVGDSSDAHDEDEGQQSGGQGRDGDAEHGDVPAEDDGHGGAERGARGDAQDVGVADGVAEDALEHAAAHGERGAGQQAHHNARQAQLPDGHVIVGGHDDAAGDAQSVQKTAPHRLQRDVDGPDEDGS